MIFLIAVSSVGCVEPLGLQEADFVTSDFGSAPPNLTITQKHNVTIVASDTPCVVGKNSDTTVLWDGAVIDGERAFSTTTPVSDAADRLNKYIDMVRAGSEPENYSGVFCCAAVRNDGSFVLTTDPLSQYAVFCTQTPNVKLFSNSIHLIEKTLHLIKAPVSRSFESNAYEAAFGAGGWTRTGLRGVKKLSPNHTVIYSRKELSFRKGLSKTITAEPSRRHYSSNIEQAAHYMLKSAAAVRNSFQNQNMVIDLSGGKDTRLILGSYLAFGDGPYHVFLGGQKGSPDYDIAAQIANHYSLESAYFPSNIGQEENISPIEVARRAAYRYMGTSNLYQSDVGSRVLNGVAKIRGGSAEGRTKSFFVYPDEKRTRRVLRYGRTIKYGWGQVSELHRLASRLLPNVKPGPKLLTAMIMSRGKRGHYLFQRQFLQSAYKSTFDTISDLVQTGVAVPNLADAYYIFDRGWRHCGFPVQIMNGFRSTFEPLNNLPLLRAQFSLPIAERGDARVTYDLFRHFAVKDLLEIPFENSEWPGDHLTNSQADRRSILSETLSSKIDHKWITEMPGNAQSIHTVGRAAYMEHVKPYFMELAHSLSPDHECWNMLNREELLSSIAGDAFADPKLASTGIRLLHAFIWVSGEELRPPFSN